MADTIFVNADVRTCDPRKPVATAFAVKDGKFISVGPSDVVLELYAEDSTTIIDAQGHTVVPGLVDGHTHLSHGMELFSPNSVDLFDITDTKEWLRIIQEAGQRISENDEHPWIVGGRWDAFQLAEGQEMPSLDELDAILPSKVAMCLYDVDFHLVWVNRRALELTGIDESTPDPPGGEIRRDASGKPSGVLLETATFLVTESESFGQRTRHATNQELVQKTFRHFNSLGVTTCHDLPMDVNVYTPFINADARPLTLRLMMGQMIVGAVDTSTKYWDELQSVQKSINEHSQEVEKTWNCGPQHRVGFAKMFIDGTLANYTAAMMEKYEDMDVLGEPFNSQENLDLAVQSAFDHGLGVAIHAIGDRGVRMCTEAFIKARNPQNCFKRLEHMETVYPADIKKFVEHGIGCSMQPTHCTAGNYQVKRIGERRVPWSYPWQKLSTTGAEIGFGSDWPTANESPLKHIQDAVLRVKADGSPYDQSNRLSFDEALYNHTQGCANLVGWQDILGSISVGKYADFVVLPTKIESEDLERHPIADLQVQQTWLAGRCVYNRDDARE